MSKQELRKVRNPNPFAIVCVFICLKFGDFKTCYEKLPEDKVSLLEIVDLIPSFIMIIFLFFVELKQRGSDDSNSDWSDDERKHLKKKKEKRIGKKRYSSEEECSSSEEDMPKSRKRRDKRDKRKKRKHSSDDSGMFYSSVINFL